jgi:hypothetical protein
MLVPSATGNVMLTRTGNRILGQRMGTTRGDVTLDLALHEAPAAQIKAVREAVRDASREYQTFRELIDYRRKISGLLLVALAGQEVLLYWIQRRSIKRAEILRQASWLAWAIGGLWLSLVYF